jgi:tetratricopeptide (TPR) repeat protein
VLGALLLLHGDFADAKASLETAVAAGNPEPETLANFGLVCLLTDDVERALEALLRARLEAREKSQHSNPAQAAVLREFWCGVHVNLALALLAAGRKDEAVDAAREAVQWRTQNKWAHLAFSQALAAAGQADAAAAAKKAAGDAEPLHGIMMLARRRMLRVTLTYGRPGWDPEPRERDYDLGTGRRDFPVLK